MNKGSKILVIFGGQSSEHEVSRVSALSVVKNIDRRRHEVALIGITKDGRWLNYNGPAEKLADGSWQTIAEAESDRQLLPDQRNYSAILKASADDNTSTGQSVIFPVLHGCNGEDGTIQGLLELTGLPYVGCGVLGSAMGMDKGYSKIIFDRAGIPQGDYLVLNRKDIKEDLDSAIAAIEKRFSYPCFVKPCNAGSSVGVSKAKNRESLINALEDAMRYDRRILIEEFINARELECGVLGNDEPKASVVGEVIACNEFYDYEAKYSSDSTSKVIIPANIPDEAEKKIREYAVKAFKALDCSGLSRVDFFLRKETGEVLINEINTMPGFTSISMYPKLWEAAGVPYPELIEKLVKLAVERHRDSHREINS
ncbi:MAG: D-alanine--D-alanine ligase [Eubacteriales bacterium]|nr:D-alanine--D-alanine ligase [Eubacteriales bacterium]